MPQFTLEMYANEPPNATSCASDAGAWERYVWVPHESRFVTNPPSSEEEQWRTRTFKADPHINVELKKRAYAYLWVLVEYFDLYTKEGLQKPEEVLKATAAYKQASDVYAQFIDSKIDKTDRHADYESLVAIYSDFKLWYTAAFPNTRVANHNDFGEELTRILGPPVGDEKRFHGVKLKKDIKTFRQ